MSISDRNIGGIAMEAVAWLLLVYMLFEISDLQ